MDSAALDFAGGKRLTQLRELRRLVENSPGARGAVKECFSSGSAAIDRLLPGGGLVRGSLVEWLADGPGCGAGALALVAAREAQGEGGVVVVVDRNQGFYPVAAAGWGLDLTSLIVIHPQNERDERWAIDQALRCSHVAATVGWPRRLDGRVFRRWQLAAEASGAVGLLVRPATMRREPSWADLRLVVSPRPAASGGWRLAVRLVRSRGRLAAGEREIEIEIDERTGEIHEAHPGDLAAKLVDPATVKRQA